MLTLQKYVADERVYFMDYSLLEEIISGELIGSVVSLTSSPPGLTLGAAIISTPKVGIPISGGTPNTLYLVDCVIRTSLSNSVISGVGNMFVLN